MSVTYSFICDEHKKSCWAGQSDYLYGYTYIAKFLHEHRGCSIRFVYDEDIPDGYKECDNNDDKPNNEFYKIFKRDLVAIKSKLLKEYEEDLKFELSKEKFLIKQKHGLDSRYTGKLK